MMKQEDTSERREPKRRCNFPVDVAFGPPKEKLSAPKNRPLTGFVSFRLNLREDNADHTVVAGCTTGKKRKRRGDDHHHHDGGDRHQPRPAAEARDDRDDASVSLEDPDVSIVAYILHEEEWGDFILSVPNDLIVLLCKSIPANMRVRVVAYSFLPLRGKACVKVREKPPMHHRRANGLRGIIEVEQNGLEVEGAASGGLLAPHWLTVRDICSHSVLEEKDNHTAKEPILTLAQVRQVEALDREIGATTRRWSVQGTVRAVSPILAQDPRNPYSLVEIVDSEAACSSLAVLRGDALAHHMALIPGRRIFLRDVKRQKWNIPNCGFRSLPLISAVLVVEQSDQFYWPPTAFNILNLHNAVLPRQRNETVATISGEVSSIRTVTIEKKEHLNAIELLDSVSSKTTQITLFVTYFPLPTCFLLALRPGARIRATNVHRVHCAGDGYYCACLRSSVSLISHGPHESKENESLPDADMVRPYAAYPCTLLPVRRPYVQLLASRAVMTLLQDIDSQNPHPPPSRSEVTNAYLKMTGLDSLQAPSHRDGIAEFLDHPTCNASVASGASRGCRLLGLDNGTLKSRVPTSLSQIQSAAMRALESSLDEWLQLQSTTCSFGSTGSILRPGSELISQSTFRIGRRSKESDDAPVTLVCASFGTEETAKVQVALSDGGRVFIPTSFDRRHCVGASGSTRFILATVNAFVCSYFCLGSVGSRSLAHSGHYPPEPGGFSSCSVMVIRGYAFLASLRLSCTECFVFKTATDSEEISRRILDANSFVLASSSINECLQSMIPPDSTHLTALLARKSLRLSKAASGNYRGCTLCVSHISPDLDYVKVDDISTIQSIDIKLTIPINDSMKLALGRRLAKMFSFALPEMQLLLACIWCQVLDEAPMLLDGGWDELTSSGSKIAQSTGVLVRVPHCSVQPDPARGYARFSCRLKDLQLMPVRLIQPYSESRSYVAEACPIDFVGRKCVLPGDLCPRPIRLIRPSNKKGTYSIGEMKDPVPLLAGIPSFTIAELFASVVADLSAESRHQVAPSLVREIRKAKLLGISYCKVAAECSTCFKALVAPSVHKNKYVDVNSFEPALAGSESVDSLRPKAAINTHLRCPSQCGYGTASVKWECSGTLDDGTGQAKLYAERDAALVLLGLSDETVLEVEKAALANPLGVVFAKGLPPPSALFVAVESARNQAIKKLHESFVVGQPARTPIAEPDILRNLSCYDRGGFLLQRHCRCSREPMRDLTYYVRCKPLSDDVLQRGFLNPTEIDVIRPGPEGGRATVGNHAATYTLPPLKLVLVDVATPTKDDSGL